jgi:hypothetical protein
MGMTDPGNAQLGDALRRHAAAGHSAVLRVAGRPGGTIYLTDGQIAGCETPGAPSLEVILLHSGRVTESDWNAAFTAAAVLDRPLPAVLVERELLGAGEAEALLRTALADAVFAVVTGRVDGWAEAPAAPCALPLSPAAQAGWLLGEATRRSQVLASIPGPALSAQDRIATGRGTGPGTERADRGLSPRQRDLLALADGRRTPRDLAFARGRGLYETMLELTRMRAAGMVGFSSAGPESTASHRPSGTAPGETDDRGAWGLPLRRRDRAGSARAAETGIRSFAANIRMLRPRSEGNALPGGGQ